MPYSVGEAGQWRCDLDAYEAPEQRGSRGHGGKASHRFEVTVTEDTSAACKGEVTEDNTGLIVGVVSGVVAVIAMVLLVGRNPIELIPTAILMSETTLACGVNFSELRSRISRFVEDTS